VRTGILGGTFDPIHVAHLHTADCALHQLRLDRVLIIPAGDPWQKAGDPITPAAHRLELCRLAVADAEGIEVDDREIRRGGSTYTIDTLDSFPGGEKLFLIMGSDALAGLRSWRRWQEVVARVTVVVAPRPGTHPDGPGVEGSITLDMALLEISGTDIRRRAREGRPYRYLVTEPVFSYIEDNNLYTNSTGDDMVVSLNNTEEAS
jgi:nicotinate-nucleotide adenylyltransferase